MKLREWFSTRRRGATSLRKDPRVQSLAITAGIGLVGATIFYRWVEGWAVLDCFYMSAMTITTVGYGDFAPSTPAGKLFTTLYAFGGIGIMFALLGLYADHMSRRHDTASKRDPPTSSQ